MSPDDGATDTQRKTMPATPLDNRRKKQLKQIAHHLDPVVTVGDQGISEPLIAETQRALADHELIKVKIHAEDRTERKALGEALAEACEAHIVQTIGKVAVLFRKNPEPNPRLSNLARFGGS